MYACGSQRRRVRPRRHPARPRAPFGTSHATARGRLRRATRCERAAGREFEIFARLRARAPVPAPFRAAFDIHAAPREKHDPNGTREARTSPAGTAKRPRGKLRPQTRISARPRAEGRSWQPRQALLFMICPTSAWRGRPVPPHATACPLSRRPAPRNARPHLRLGPAEQVDSVRLRLEARRRVVAVAHGLAVVKRNHRRLEHHGGPAQGRPPRARAVLVMVGAFSRRPAGASLAPANARA